MSRNSPVVALRRVAVALLVAAACVFAAWYLFARTDLPGRLLDAALVRAMARERMAHAAQGSVVSSAGAFYASAVRPPAGHGEEVSLVFQRWRLADGSFDLDGLLPECDPGNVPDWATVARGLNPYNGRCVMFAGARVAASPFLVVTPSRATGRPEEVVVTFPASDSILAELRTGWTPGTRRLIVGTVQPLPYPDGRPMVEAELIGRRGLP